SVVAVFSEYSLSQVSGAICPNILLRQAGFLDVREINGREYLDIEMSRAFAMVDHQVAHIYVKKHYEEDVMELLKKVDGIQMILTEELQKEYKINHERSGELLAVTQPDRWFAYYWWESPEKAPDFAHHMDIHRKPGFDPLELFFDFENMIIPTDTSLIKGSHGVPCKEDERMALLLLNGRNLKDLHMASTIEMVEVAPLLTDILREEE
ncbi:MAG: alkaline phosphatase family protein, partial [Thermodesulfobacteriota bacterium]|nr:alkaline phosphatase family protein [Thermodesulfobacteriota bacterium]